MIISCSNKNGGKKAEIKSNIRFFTKSVEWARAKIVRNCFFSQRDSVKRIESKWRLLCALLSYTDHFCYLHMHFSLITVWCGVM